MQTKSSLIGCGITAALFPVVGFLFNQPAQAFARVSTISGINLVDLQLEGFDTTTSPVFIPISSTEVSGQDSIAKAFADVTKFEIKTFSRSDDSEDIFISGSTGLVDSDYQLVGLPEGSSIRVPLNFNVRLEGVLEASSEPLDDDSYGSSGVLYDFIHNDSRIMGSASLTSFSGLPPVLTGSLTFLGETGNLNWNRESLFRYSVNELISLPALTDNFGGGFFISSLQSFSQSDDGFALSDFYNTYTLESISIGEGFDTADLDGLEVVFDGGGRFNVDIRDSDEPGDDMNVTNPQTPGPEPQPVPEPASLLAIILCMFGLSSSILRKKVTLHS